MNNFYTCRACSGTMNGQFCEDCGFDELQFVNEWDEFRAAVEDYLDSREAWNQAA